LRRGAAGWALAALLAGGAAPAGPASPGPAASPAPARPAGDRLAAVRARRAALERELVALRGQERSLLGEVEQLEIEVRLRGEQLRELQLELARTNAELDRTLARARGLEASLRERRPRLAARARQLYVLGELSYLRLLLSVDQPSEMLRGYRLVSELARRDNEVFAAFRADLEAARQTRDELERRTQEALRQRSEVDQARRGLDAERRRKTAALARLVETKESRDLYLQEVREAEEKLQGLVEGMAEADVLVPLSVFRGALPWPVTGPVRVPFGPRKHPRFETYTVSNGIEIGAAPDTKVAAVQDGLVAFADRFRGYGLMAILDHGAKHHTLYGHLGELLVRAGQRVAAGETLGSVGALGGDPGLYFEVRFQGRPEDPLEWLQQARRAGRARR
jgi:septal ring factor EnvC (AmiA/AmiB activator)